MTDADADATEPEPEPDGEQTASASGDHDLTAEQIREIGSGGPVYRDESGEYYSFLQIALRGVKQGYQIDETEDGFIVEGELFERVAVPDSGGDANADPDSGGESGGTDGS